MSVYYKVYCPSSISRGDVLYYNSSSSTWEIAPNDSGDIGVARTDAVARGDLFSTELVLSGLVFAKASRSIPVQGGQMHIENGAIYVDGSSVGRGLVCPQEIDNTTPRNAGDLVAIILG